jgi:hypothetical protein
MFSQANCTSPFIRRSAHVTAATLSTKLHGAVRSVVVCRGDHLTGGLEHRNGDTDLVQYPSKTQTSQEAKNKPLKQCRKGMRYSHIRDVTNFLPSATHLPSEFPRHRWLGRPLRHACVQYSMFASNLMIVLRDESTKCKRNLFLSDSCRHAHRLNNMSDQSSDLWKSYTKCNV